MKLIVLFFIVILNTGWIMAGPGFTCLKAAGSPAQYWNLDKIQKGKSFEIPSTNSSQSAAAAKVTLSACHSLDTIPSSCNKDTLSNAIGVVTGDVNAVAFCEPLSQNGKDKNTNTKWTFLPIDPKAGMFNSLIVKGTQQMFYMLRGAPMAVSDNSEITNNEQLLQAVDFGNSWGLKIVGKNIGNNNLNYDVVLNMRCDKAMKNGVISNSNAVYDSASSTYTIGWTSKNNCGFDMFSFWNALGWGQYIIEGVLAVGCLVMCFLGFKIYKPSLGIIGFLVGALATYIFLNLFSSPDADNHWYMWVVIGVSVLLGIVVAVLLVVVEKLSLFGAGAFLGYVGGSELYSLFIYRLDGAGTPVWLYVTVVVLAIVGGVLALWLHDQILILATAVGGAWLAVRLVGTMVGNYPNEMTVAQQIEAGEWDGMPWENYVYILSQLVLAVAGTIVQFFMRNNNKKDEGNGETPDYNPLI